MFKRAHLKSLSNATVYPLQAQQPKNVQKHSKEQKAKVIKRSNEDKYLLWIFFENPGEMFYQNSSYSQKSLDSCNSSVQSPPDGSLSPHRSSGCNVHLYQCLEGEQKVTTPFFFIRLLIKTSQTKSTKGANCSNLSHRIRQIPATRDRRLSFPETLIPGKLFLYSLQVFFSSPQLIL